MSATIYAAGCYADGTKFLLTFETKRDARTWAAQNAAVISRLWALYESAAA